MTCFSSVPDHELIVLFETTDKALDCPTAFVHLVITGRYLSVAVKRRTSPNSMVVRWICRSVDASVDIIGL